MLKDLTEQKSLYPAPKFKQFRLENEKCFEKSVKYLDEHYMNKDNPLIMSRVLRMEKIEGKQKRELVEHVATEDFILQKNDIVTVVGKKAQLELLELVFGEEVPVNLLNKDIVALDTEVTAPAFGNKRLSEFNMPKYKVIVTRVLRGETEFSPNNDTLIEFGDMLHFVGLHKDTIGFAKVVCEKNKTLIAGLFMSTKKRLGKMEIHVPVSALKILQDLGLTIFMAGAGLIAGGRFMLVFHQYGFELLFEGALVTLVTLLSGAIYMHFIGAKTLATMAAISAGMTQPSALEVTKQQSKTELPLLAYASVYPFAMILKIILVQVLIVIVNAIAVLS